MSNEYKHLIGVWKGNSEINDILGEYRKNGIKITEEKAKYQKHDSKRPSVEIKRGGGIAIG